MDNMLANGLDKIVKLAQVESFKKVYDDHEAITYLNGIDGRTVSVNKGFPPIGHTMHDIDSLVLWLENSKLECISKPTIFVATDSITLIADFTTYRVNRIKVPLIHSPIVRYLREGLQADPKEFIRSLKFNLSSATLTDDPIPALQTLKFESSATAEHTNAQNDEGVSKSLKSKVSGAAEIPARFTAEFEMYPAIAEELENNGNVNVDIELHVDPTRGIVSFRTLPGSIDKAIIAGHRMVKDSIFKKLIAADMEAMTELVFLGSP